MSALSISSCIVAWRVRRFFFSSRRRHTRYWRDWSSDVCSSDLGVETGVDVDLHACRRLLLRGAEQQRSEERRVGKEGREENKMRATEMKGAGEVRVERVHDEIGRA